MTRVRIAAAVSFAAILITGCGIPPITTVTSATPSMSTVTPSAHSEVTLEVVERSIVLIQMAWSGYVFVPDRYAESGTGFWSDRVTGYASCTGFFVAKDAMIATAGHCVDPQMGGRMSLATQYLTEVDRTDLIETAYQNWTMEGDQTGSAPALQLTVFQPTNLPDAVVEKPQTAQVLDFQPFSEGDNALIRIAALDGTPPLALAEETPSLGEELTCVGFPGVVRDVVDRTTINRASFKLGNVSSKQTLSSGAPVTEVSADIAEGMSGGPAINSAAEVVGINSSGVGVSGGFNFITDTKDLRLFLRRNGVGD